VSKEVLMQTWVSLGPNCTTKIMKVTLYLPKGSWIGHTVRGQSFTPLCSEQCWQSKHIPLSIHCSNPTGSLAVVFSILNVRTDIVNKQNK
jgi:hypothetical protein